MPIKPENRKRYPKNWKSEIRPEVLERAGHCCEGSPKYPDCRVANYENHPVTDSKVVLTIAHLDHDPTNNGQLGDRPNLKAWCQKCHNTYDAPHQRKRVFIMAHANDSGLPVAKQMGCGESQKSTIINGCDLANPNSFGKQQWKKFEPKSWNWIVNRGKGLAHSRSARLERQGHREIRTGQKFPMPPGECQYEWEQPRTIKPRLGGADDEHSSGLDPNRNRIDRLRLLGNGVVPATAELAFRTLMNELAN